MQPTINSHRVATRGRADVLARAVLAATVLLFTTTPLSAQFAVYDAATTARNTTTAALKEVLYQLQRQQQEKIREMARRLSAVTNLDRYMVLDVPGWGIHGSARFVFALPYLEALTSGDPRGAAHLRLAASLELSARLGQLPTAVQRAITSRLAAIDLADATAVAGIHASGELRLSGRRNELQVIDILERDVIDPSQEQSTTAVLDKISGASLVGARQRQARIQLLTSLLEQLLVENKQLRDTDAAALNMQLVTWRDRRAADDAFVAGSSHALKTWRQP